MGGPTKDPDIEVAATLDQDITSIVGYEQQQVGAVRYGHAVDIEEEYLQEEDTTRISSSDNAQASAKSLVEAVPVKERQAESTIVPESELVEGQTVKPDPKLVSFFKSPKGGMTLFLLVLVILGGAIATAIVCTSGLCTPSKEETTKIDKITVSPLRDLVPDYTLVSLEDPTSPQSKAYDFVESHYIFSDYPDWRKKQIFAIFTVFMTIGLDVLVEFFDIPEEGFMQLLYTLKDECKMEDVATAFSTETLVVECNEHKELIGFKFNGLFGNWIAGIVGGMPPEVSMLTNLEFARLRNVYLYNEGHLTRFFTPEWTSLPVLRTCEFSNTDVMGTLPTELGLMKQLETLLLHSNELSGTVPTEIGLMTSLSALYIHGNNLSGILPNELCSLPSLSHLHVDCNKVTCPEECDCRCCQDDESCDVTYMFE